jgi:hypothetical protein
MASENEELEQYIHRLLFAHNGLEELEKIVLELSIKNDNNEHKNNDMKFIMPTDPTSNQKSIAA